MEFLRLLCENHHTEMQDYMRTQPENSHSHNVVSIHAQSGTSMRLDIDN